MTAEMLNELIAELRQFYKAEFNGFQNLEFRNGFNHAIGLLEMRRNALVRGGE